ncbi:hypothetical protein D3C85_1253920 [compost metagenome]
MAQLFTAHQVDQGIRCTEQGFAAKADGNQMFDFAEREACHLLCLGNNRRKIIAFKVAHARPTDDAAGPDTIVIRAHGRIDDAV